MRVRESDERKRGERSTCERTCCGSLVLGSATEREDVPAEHTWLTGHERPQAAKQRVDAKREVATPFSFSFPFYWVYV